MTLRGGEHGVAGARGCSKVAGVRTWKGIGPVWQRKVEKILALAAISSFQRGKPRGRTHRLNRRQLLGTTRAGIPRSNVSRITRDLRRPRYPIWRQVHLQKEQTFARRGLRLSNY